MPLYQQWVLPNGTLPNGTSFFQASTVLSLYQPIGSAAGLFLRGSGGTTRGDVTTLQGLADVQIGGNYHWEKTHLVFSLGINLPIIKKKLTSPEFQTSLLLSNTVFDMHVPSLGTGLNIDAGVIWAIPISEAVVVGLGGSFLYKGVYEPISNAGEYDPGDEILATGGVDIQTESGSTISADLIFTTSGKDKLKGKEVLSAGNRIVANLQLRQSFGLHGLWLFARYKTRSTSSFAVGNAFVAEAEKLEPDNVDAVGTFNIRVNDRLSFVFLAQGRFYKQTPLTISGISLFAAGFSPVFAVSNSLSVSLRNRFHFGSLKGGDKLTGLELGVGIAITY